MRRRLRVLVVVLGAAAAACGGGGGQGARAPAQGGDAADGATATGDGAPAPVDAPGAPAARPLERADCLRLLDRYLELELAELRATRSPDEIPTDEQIAEIRAQMEREDLAGCIGAPRAPFDCAMRADTKVALRACFAGP